MKIYLRAILLSSSIILYSESLSAQCTVTNPSSVPNSSDQGTGPGLIAWTNPANAEISDNIFTTAQSKVSASTTQLTHYIYARNFGFTLISSAIICGIQVTVQRKQQGVVNTAYVRDNSIQLVNGSGVLVGSNYAISGDWPSTPQTVTYGGPEDMWGTSLTQADINSGSFGIMFTANLTAGSTMANLSAQIDYITVAVAYYDGALPIELLSFTGSMKNARVDLNWKTASETNTNHFVVERSKDAGIFEPVTTVKAAGNSNKTLSYNCTDEQPINGLAYYRLKEVDNNGAVNYSGAISVSAFEKPGFNKAFPLKGNILALQLTINEATNVEINVLNLTGKKIQTFSQDMPKGFSNVNINVENLDSGIYFVEARLPNEEFYRKVYVQKE